MKQFLYSIFRQIQDKLIDIFALFVAIIALLTAIEQGKTQKKLEIVNKQPLLVLEFNKIDSLKTKGFLLSNVGFGPAIIKSFRYYKNEAEYVKKRYHTEWLDQKGISKAIMLGFRFREINSLEPGYIIKHDQSLYLLATSAKNFYDSPTSQSMSEAIIELKYKSISPLDTTTYFLRFCENFKENNVRDIGSELDYEKNL